MEQQTRTEYKRLAEHFYKKRVGASQLSPKRVQDALKQAASDYRPAYWRRLRKAIEIDQRDKGYKDAADRIAGTKNPVTVTGSGQEVKAKQSRCRRVSDRDHLELVSDCERRGDRSMMAALVVSEHTGLRPAEIPHVSISDDGRTVFIQGVKKSHDGTRGADRFVTLDEEEAKQVRMVARFLPGTQKEVSRVQRRLQAAAQRIFPRRKVKPSLYSYRHQIGSDLKRSGMDRKQIAYVMGHQGTKAVERYGNSRMARGKRGIRPDSQADMSQVKENHTEPMSKQVEPAKPSRAPDPTPSSTPGMSM